MDYPISHLKALLSDRAGLELSPIELAEILWLALQQGEIELDESETPASQAPIEESQEVETVSDPIRSNSESAAVVTEPPKPAEEEVEESEPRSQESALPVKIPESVALRNRQAIARSIRPLMRKVASKQRRSIDEEATAIQIAETQTWSPVVQPDPERWLELAIVIEVTNLLEVWRDTIAEFQQLMERHGAFRTVRTWQLKPNEDGEPQLFLQTVAGLRSRARSPRELLDSAGRRLILLLSDCTSRAWRSGKIPELLELWAQENPVTIVQLLPESYWERSALSAGYPVGLKSRLPGALSRDWSIEGLSARQRQRLPEGLNLPVVTMQPESFRQWAKALSAMDEQQTIGVVLNLQAFPMPSLAQATPLTAKQLVQRFRSTASAKAQELADMMAVLPVNWSVIRLIQKNLPADETENALYLAEIFLSGLLHPIDAHYDFVEGVREVLLKTIPISEAQAVGEEVTEAVFKQLPSEVQERVNADISRRFGEGLSYFEAFLIPDLPWGESAASEIFPFARVGRQVLAQWGEEYAAWAEELAGSSQVSEIPLLQEFDEAAIEEENAAIAWFRERQFEVQSFRSNEMEVFDRFALDLGDHYDVLAPVLVQMRRAFLRKQRDFHYALGEISEEMISRCVGFGHNLLNAELLTEFHYDRATKTVRGTMADQPDLAEFFMGVWFERYIYQKVANLLRERELRFSSLSNVTVTLPSRDRFELALFFLVEDEPLLIECFTDRDIDRAIQRISQSAQRLEISDSRIFCIGLEMTLAQIAELHQQHRVTVGNRETFLAQIRTALVSEASLPTFSFEVITVNDRGEEIDRRPGQASYYREELAEGVFLDMVEIPGGTFWMGAADREFRASCETPRHQVTIEPFFMGKFAVTQAQWKEIAQLPKINRDLKPEPSRFKGNNRPVEQVSWEDAIEFCDRLNRKTGRLYRLPSEAEWEYTCRAGTTTPFHFGETITPDLVNYDGNHIYANASEGIYRKQTIDIGSFPPNAFGLYDMHGNAWEWCADPWHDSYTNAPTDGRVWEMESNLENTVGVLRGGSWDDYPWNCRTAYRLMGRRDDSKYWRGFRLALSRSRTS